MSDKKLKQIIKSYMKKGGALTYEGKESTGYGIDYDGKKTTGFGRVGGGRVGGCCSCNKFDKIEFKPDSIRFEEEEDSDSEEVAKVIDSINKLPEPIKFKIGSALVGRNKKLRKNAEDAEILIRRTRDESLWDKFRKKLRSEMSDEEYDNLDENFNAFASKVYALYKQGKWMFRDKKPLS